MHRERVTLESPAERHTLKTCGCCGCSSTSGVPKRSYVVVDTRPTGIQTPRGTSTSARKRLLRVNSGYFECQNTGLQPIWSGGRCMYARFNGKTGVTPSRRQDGGEPRYRHKQGRTMIPEMPFDASAGKSFPEHWIFHLLRPQHRSPQRHPWISCRTPTVRQTQPGRKSYR